MERLSWNQYFMAQSHLLANRSTCTRLAVGATIVRDKRVIAGGYNGSISGDVHCIDEGCYVVDHHCIRTIHAEMNAIIQCAKFGVQTQDAEIYVTHFPCIQCCKAIIQSGISKVYYAKDYKNSPYAIELFQSAGVDMVHVPLENMTSDGKRDEKLAYITELLHQLDATGVDPLTLKAYYDQANELFSLKE